MHTPSEILGAVTCLYRIMPDKKIDDGVITGTIPLNTDTYNKLRLLDEIELLLEVYINDRLVFLEDLKIQDGSDQSLKVHIAIPNSDTKGYFRKDFDHYLGSYYFQSEKPEYYYIADLDFLSTENNVYPIISKYNQVIELVKLLSEICDHQIKEHFNIRFILLDRIKVEIPILYKTHDLVNLKNLDQVESLISLIRNGDLADQRKIILKKVLTEALRHRQPDKCFLYILNNFENIKKQFDDNYELYIRSFSFEKLKEEIEEKKIEYLAKLNGVIGDIKNKLLAIPLAVIVIGTQYKYSGCLTLQNILILIGILFFVILMTILIVNQGHTLLHINNEIEGLKTRFENKYSDIEKKFKKDFDVLKRRYRWQVFFLITILLIIWSVGFTGVYVFDLYTPGCQIFPFRIPYIPTPQ